MDTDLRQFYLDQAHEHQLADGVLDVFVDIDGTMRGNGIAMDAEHVKTIVECLSFFDRLINVDIRFVETEFESELSIHEADPTVGYGGWSPNLANVAGLVHSKGLHDNNMYFMDSVNEDNFMRMVIYHEMAHIFGRKEHKYPFIVEPTETIMSYRYDGEFYGYTEDDVDFFLDKYGGVDEALSLFDTHVLYS